MSRLRRRRVVFGGGAAILLVPFLWFAAIHESAYLEICVHCENRRVSHDTSVCGILVSQDFHLQEQSFQSRVGQDLGIPCPHQFARKLVATRYGLLWERPAVLGCWTMSLRPFPAPEWYEKNSAVLVAELKAQHPELLRDFREKAFLHFDATYWGQLLDCMEEILEKQS